MAGDKPFFLTQNPSFASYDESADFLHPERNKAVTADSATETQYFGYSIPEDGIHSLNYLWHRPNLKILTGGVWAWQGFKPNAVHSELCDLRTFHNDAPLKNDLHEFRLDNGYGVKMLEPLKRFHMTYSDPKRSNSVDLVYEAVSPVVMFADQNHFEQVMQVKGEVVLRGKSYKVDGFNVRDRSWGKPRPEDIMTLPPTSWMTCVFDKDFSVNCNVLDQASRNPELTGAFAIPDEGTLAAGWIWRDGKVGRIVKASKRVVRAPVTLLAMSIELEVQDDLGRGAHLRGTLINSCPWQTWANVNMHIGLMRWECEGRVGYGDCQEAIWGDYLNFMANRA